MAVLMLLVLPVVERVPALGARPPLGELASPLPAFLFHLQWSQGRASLPGPPPGGSETKSVSR